MPDWDFERSIESMRLQATLAIEYGMTLEAVLSGTGVSESMIKSQSAYVAAAQELRLIENIITGLPNVPALGLEAGSRYHFTAFGMLGFAMVSSKTLREALAVGLQYFNLTFAFTRFHVEDTDQHTTLMISTNDIPDKLKRYIIERDSACLMTLQRDLCATPPIPQTLEFQLSRPDDLSKYQEIFGIVPTFLSNQNIAIYDRDVMESPMPQYNALACQMAQEHCRDLLDQSDHQGGFAAKVRNLIADSISTPAGMEQIANNLHMTPRTLHRKLKAMNSSFIGLRDQVRRSLADEYLFDLGLSVEQTSFRLGYSEATTFINAYKRWYGITPHARRLAK
jgi:AraC-like DNA-binding protein